MMCGWMPKANDRASKSDCGFGRMTVTLQQGCCKSPKWVIIMPVWWAALLGTIALNIWLYISIPAFFRSRTLAC